MAYVVSSTERDPEKQNRSIRNAHERIAGLALDDISDVNAPSPTDGQILTWDDGNGEWVPDDAPTSGRELLTAARTYYVNKDTGSDSNNGLTSGTAVATIQKAYDLAAVLDFGGKAVTIEIGGTTPATYTAGLLVSTAWAGGGSLTIKGSTGTATDIVISTTSANAISFTVPLPGTVTIQDLKIQTTTSGNCINLDTRGRVHVSNVNFGACATYMMAASANGAVIQTTGNYAVSGSAQGLWVSFLGGQILAANRTVTFSNSPAFSLATAYCIEAGIMRNFGNTFTNGGTVTGTRYTVSFNGVINVAGGGANAIPGNVAGSTATGGQYA